MNSIDYTQLISSLEADCISDKNFEVAEKIQNIIEKHKDDLSVEQKQFLTWEFLLFRLMTRNRFECNGLITPRFVPMVTYTNGALFPDPDTFSPEAFEYFKGRLQECTNPVFKARYSDILAEKSHFKNTYAFATASIEQHLKAVDLYQDEENDINKIDAIQRAAELAIKFESKGETKTFSSLVTKKLQEQIEETIKKNKYRWLLEMFEIVIAMKDLYTVEEFDSYVKACDLAAKFYLNDKNYHLQRSFLETKMQLMAAKNIGDQQSVRDSIGESLVEEAMRKTESGIARAHVLKTAIDHYNKNGNKQKVEELIGHLKSATKQAISNEFQTITVPFNISKEEIQRLKESMGTGMAVLENLGSLRIFAPKWKFAIEMTEKQDKTSISHIFGSVHYGEEYPVGFPTTEEEMKEDRVMQNFKLQIQLNLRLLSDFLFEFIEKEQLNLDNFEKFFEKLKLIDPETYETIIEGVKDYLKGDHFRAATILAPQLEDLLRRILGLNGGQTTKVIDNAFGEKTLGPILDELRPAISDSLYYYIQWIMRDYRGLNLRNSVAHGAFKKKNADIQISTSVLHVLCILCLNINLE